MENNKDIRSNFVSPYGILFLLFLCIVSTYFQVTGLPLFLFFVLLLVTAAWIWGRKALQNLEVTAQGQSCRVFPGEEIHFSLTVTNRKMLPLLWVDAELPRPEREFVQAEDGFSRRFTWLMSWQSLIWENRWKAIRRGVTTLNHVRITSGDGLGLSVDSRDMRPPEHLLFVVYPNVFPVNTQGFLQDTADLQPGHRGYHEDPTLLRGSRAYQPGDNSRYINWRVLARQGEMTVNLYEPLQPRCVSFLLDLKSFTRWKEEETNSGRRIVLDEFHEEAMEDMISLTASCILSLTEQKLNCALVLPYTSKKPGHIVNPGNDESAISELLTELSALEYTGEHSILPAAEIHRNSHKLGQIYVICESQESLTCQDILDSLEENRICLLVHKHTSPHPIYKIKELASLKKSEPQ